MDKNSKETQYEKFVRVAKEMRADESEEAFNATLKKIAKAKPPLASNDPKD